MRCLFVSAVLVVCLCVPTPVLSHAGHEMSGEKPSSFNDPKITQDEAHLKEHLKDEINMDPNQKMTPEQMEFHYFRIHDVNNDTHLDGLEILQAMSHMMPVPELELHEKLGKSKDQIEEMMVERQKGMMKYYEDVIDRVLHDDDKDGDGYLNYAEFIRARRRDEYHQRQMMEQQMRHQQAAQFEQFQQFQAMQAQQAAQFNQHNVQQFQQVPPVQPPGQLNQPAGQPPHQPPAGQPQHQPPAGQPQHQPPGGQPQHQTPPSVKTQ